MTASPCSCSVVVIHHDVHPSLYFPLLVPTIRMRSCSCYYYYYYYYHPPIHPLGYVCQTGLANYSGYEYNGWLIRVWVPLLIVLSGIGLFMYSWLFGHGGAVAEYAVCDYGDGPCCGSEWAKGEENI
mmetsp:Transcript_8164/g.13222  ORF Transcript_8164/g.13222 Transcript_8164/m.13222 type:complete len:127 (+) Transcript_8164:1074-1454(+)